MTELQVTINNLKDVLTRGNRLLFQLEKAQKDLEKPKVPVFPPRFIAVKDVSIKNNFVIGLAASGYGHLQHWPELPDGFKGRALFSVNEIQQIITGLQTLLGEQQ